MYEIFIGFVQENSIDRSVEKEREEKIYRYVLKNVDSKVRFYCERVDIRYEWAMPDL